MPQIIQQTGTPFNAFYGLGGQAPLIPNAPAAAVNPFAYNPLAYAPATAPATASSQKTTLQTNNNNFGDISALVDKINNLNIQAQQASNAARIPNATGLESLSSANIGSALGGQLPNDVVAQISQAAAERGVGGGQMGGDQVNSAYLRALGLNSLNMQNTGQEWLSSAYARNPGAPLFDVGSLLITPYQQAAIDQQNAQLELERQRLAQQAKIAEQELAQRNAALAIQQFNDMLRRGKGATPNYSNNPASAAVGNGFSTGNPRLLWPGTTYNQSVGAAEAAGNSAAKPGWGMAYSTVPWQGPLLPDDYSSWNLLDNPYGG